MPKMNLSHFEAAILFSLFTSVVLGVVTKRTDKERIEYGVYTFLCFLVALFGLGWLMFPGPSVGRRRPGMPGRYGVPGIRRRHP